VCTCVRACMIRGIPFDDASTKEDNIEDSPKVDIDEHMLSTEQNSPQPSPPKGLKDSSTQRNLLQARKRVD
jgi:hypothetical protein